MWEIYFSQWCFWVWAYYYSSLTKHFLGVTFTFYLSLYTDFALGLAALDATGICVGKCADPDLILGVPALDVDAVGLSAIRHSTICQILSLNTSKNISLDL